MRTLPPALVEQAYLHGLEIHNYFKPPCYAEVFIPAAVAGCMLRGDAKAVDAFLLLFDSRQLDASDRDALVDVMSVHRLGTFRKDTETAVCFPDWQFEPEEDT